MKQTLTAPKKAQHGSARTAQRATRPTGTGPQAALMQMQSRYGNRAVTQWMKSQKPIQRTIKGGVGGNLWANVGESGLAEQSERVQKVVYLLHSTGQVFWVDSFDTLFEEIQAGRYDGRVERILNAHFDGASLEEVPLEECKFDAPPTASTERETRSQHVNIGIPYRTDAGGATHEGNDRASVTAINHVSDRVKTSPVTLPEGASGASVHRNVDTLDYDLMQDVDGLYIPGGPFPNDTQVASEHSTNKEKDKKESMPSKARQPDMVNRSQYELKLIEKARTLGMPMMAICGGSWRLLEAYGGQVETLPEAERVKHKSPHKTAEKVWGLKHDLNVEADSMLADTIPEGSSLNLPGANSTHWAAASVNRDKEMNPTGLVPNAKERAKLAIGNPEGKRPDDMLKISATAPGAYGPTVEGFETKRGAPSMGIQWHPESYLPTRDGYDKASPEHRQQSATLFRHFAEAAGTYRNRRTVVAEFKQEQAILDLVKECHEQIAQRNSVGTGNLYGEIQRLLHELGATKGRAFDAVKNLDKALADLKEDWFK